VTLIPERAITRRAMLAFVGASALACACGGADRTPSPVSIEIGRDECDYCRMIIDDAALAAQHVGTDAGAHRFGEVGCLLAWLAGRDRAAGGAPFVALDGTWVPAESARYARRRTPMRFDVVTAPGSAPADQTFEWSRLRREGVPRVHAT
jgi:hypothetical protein